MDVASDRLAGVKRGWLLVAVAGLCGCTWAGAAEYTVSGKVSLGPMCGGAQREGQSCDIDYADVEVRLLDAEGRRLASARTDARGTFKLAATSRDVKLLVMAPKVVQCPQQALRLPVEMPVAVACDSGRR